MILSTVTFLPLAGAVAIAFVPRAWEEAVKRLAFVTALATFAASVPLFTRFDARSPDYQFVESASWMPSFGIGYHVGVDGISLLLVLLTTLMPLSVGVAALHRAAVEEFAITMLLWDGDARRLVALDLFPSTSLEVMPGADVPDHRYLGRGARVYAAVKFVLYTLVGSLLMLVAILALYFRHGAATGVYTFDLPALSRFVIPAGGAQDLMFLAFFLAFAIKVPMFPFHTWLPDAHVEAPTAGSVIPKMGTYGFLRFCLPLFPQASLLFAPSIMVLAIIGIIYGAWVSTVQPDIKKLVAYSSVSHLGFVVVGLFTLTAQGLVGGIIQMVNHGLSTGALFLLVGMIYERRHTRLIADFGGLWSVIPAFSVLFLIVSLSSLGSPASTGSSASSRPARRVRAEPPGRRPRRQRDHLAAVCALDVLRVVPRGHAREPPATDLSAREWAVLLPVIAFVVWIGVYTTFTGLTRRACSADRPGADQGLGHDRADGEMSAEPILFPAVNLHALAPVLVLTGTALLVLLLDLLPPRDRKDHLGAIGLLGVVGSLFVTVAFWGTDERAFGGISARRLRPVLQSSHQLGRRAAAVARLHPPAGDGVRQFYILRASPRSA
jgi:NADH-quinone oxidoreductase subunit M